MVFTVSVKYLSYKQDIHDIDLMLEDQVSTYAILKYAGDIPDIYYMEAMDDLSDVYTDLTYPKLIELVYQYMCDPMEVEID
jgi:hypothetical protein